MNHLNYIFYYLTNCPWSFTFYTQFLHIIIHRTARTHTEPRSTCITIYRVMKNFSLTLELLEMVAAADDFDGDVRLLAERITRRWHDVAYKKKSYTSSSSNSARERCSIPRPMAAISFNANRRRWPLIRLFKCIMHCHYRLFSNRVFFLALM